MDMITISAKTVEEAITKALIQLEITSDKLEYEVVEKGSTGLLGLIGTKPAVIRAKKKEEKEIIQEVKPAPAVFNTAQPEASAKKTEVSGDVPEIIRTFLNQVFTAMNLAVTVEVTVKEDEVEVNLIGEDMGVLIGKRGQTLDSLQYLVSLVVNKNSAEYVRIKLDTENYRERRKETLETLAKNIAYKVKRTKRSVSLEPMNPYERRIIHASLQNDKYVVTRSDGEEPFRHVVISLKREGGGYKKER